jgi:hypothetical protein
VTEQQITEASKMWKAGYSGLEISQHFGLPQSHVNWIARSRRDLFPFRQRRGKQVKYAIRDGAASYPTMVWTTEFGAKVTLPAISFLMEREAANA